MYAPRGKVAGIKIVRTLHELLGLPEHSEYKRHGREGPGWENKQHSNLRQMG